MPALSLYDHTFRAMGSPCALRLVAPDAMTAERAFALARDEVERLEQKYSRYREDSLLSSINRVADAGGVIDVDDETAGLLDYAATCFAQSDGLFDISSGLLGRAWHFREPKLPDAGLLAELLGRVGWQRLVWARPTLRFSPGMALDFGGVVKEYAADRVAALLRESGIRYGLVNLGGDVRALGPMPDGRPWQVGIQHPRADGTVEVAPLDKGGIATSGDYARCFELDGVRYAHILNPKTGWPVKRLASVSVVADLCVVAGSASTIAMLKEDDGPAWLASLGLPHLWVATDGRRGGRLGR